MSADSQNAIYWLVIATSISGITSSCLFMLQRGCGHFAENLKALSFQKMGRLLDIREDTFHTVTNIYSLPRLLGDLGIHSARMVWLHDANAQTNDCVQWGWFRLPTRSHLLYFLALCGITHYAYIPHDLSSFHIVGPRTGISTLVQMSNLAATQRPSTIHLQELRSSFGMVEDTYTTADQICCKIERQLAVVFCKSLLLGTLGVLSAVYLMSLPIFPGVFIAVWMMFCAICSEWRNAVNVHMIVEHETAMPRELEEALLSGAGENSAVSENVEVHIQDASIESFRHNGNEGVYNILVPTNYYYEVVMQKHFPPTSDDIPEWLIEFNGQCQCYAIPCEQTFITYIAQRTYVPSNASLSICVYNPFTDPHLNAMRNNFQKGVDRENKIVIVFPPLDDFEFQLTQQLPRSRTAKGTQYVTTLSDFQSLLQNISLQCLPDLVCAFPTNSDEARIKELRAWRCCEDIFGADQCHIKSKEVIRNAFSSTVP